jgi:hypothetical protein
MSTSYGGITTRNERDEKKTFFASVPDAIKQDCQMAYFQNKNTHLDKFWRAFGMKNVVILYDYLVYFTAIGIIGIFYGHLVYFPRFGILDQEKSGNPGS